MFNRKEKIIATNAPRFAPPTPKSLYPASSGTPMPKVKGIEKTLEIQSIDTSLSRKEFIICLFSGICAGVLWYIDICLMGPSIVVGRIIVHLCTIQFRLHKK